MANTFQRLSSLHPSEVKRTQSTGRTCQLDHPTKYHRRWWVRVDEGNWEGFAKEIVKYILCAYIHTSNVV